MSALIVASLLPAYLLAKFFVNNRPSNDDPKALVGNAMGFGLLALVIAAGGNYLLQLVAFGGVDQLEIVSQSSILESSDMLFVLGFAFIEELAKFVPLAIYIYKKPFFNEMTDGVIYFAISGLTFGAVETLLYSFEGGFINILFRYGIGLFLHAAFTSIVGYCLISYKLHRASPFMMIGALGLVTIMHALYNIGVYNSTTQPLWLLLSGAVSIIATSLMLVLYFKSCKYDHEHQKQDTAVPLTHIAGH